MKLVVNTNVLLSGSMWRGASSLLVDALLVGEAPLCVSESLLAELAEVLKRDKFRARLVQSRQDAAVIVARFREVSQVVDPVDVAAPADLRDVDDLHVLATAVGAAADAIVTGDRDLLHLGAFEGIPILGVRETLLRLGLETA